VLAPAHVRRALDLRFSEALVTTHVAATRTLRRAFQEHAVALFALPADPRAWLSPYASRLLQGTLELLVAVRLHVARIAIGPLAELRRVSGALDAPNMATLFAGGGGRRDEKAFAFVAGAADTLLWRLVGQFAARLCRDGQELLLLGSNGAFLLLLLSLVAGGPLLGIARALLAALVLALGAHLVDAVGSPAVVTSAVDAHADGFLDTLHVDGLGRRGDPLVRLQSQPILCKQGAGSFLLEDAAVELLGARIGTLGGGSRWLGSWNGSGAAG